MLLTTDLREDGFAGSAGGCGVEFDEAAVEEDEVVPGVVEGAERAG